jgi:hypothetical protein
MAQLFSELYRKYIKHSLLFINLHVVPYFIREQTIPVSSQHFAHSPHVITRQDRNLLRHVLRNQIPDLLSGFTLPLTLT